MKRALIASLSLLLLHTGYAGAQEAQQPAQVTNNPGPPPAPGIQPSTPQPNLQPPAPPQQVPVPPQQEVAVQVQQPAPPAGQWVFTQQYGWLWMPYGPEYTSYPQSEGIDPYEYVYYPSYGWMWLAAPWVYGWGSTPYWGAYGVTRFGWYRHGYAYYGGYRGYRYPAHAYGPGFYGRYRGGFVGHFGGGGGYFGGGAHIGGGHGGGHGGGGWGGHRH